MSTQVSHSTIAPVPTLTDAVISYQMALTHPGLTRPVAYVGGVALANLLAHAPAGQRASAILAAWMPLVSPERGRASPHAAARMVPGPAVILRCERSEPRRDGRAPHHDGVAIRR